MLINPLPLERGGGGRGEKENEKSNGKWDSLFKFHRYLFLNGPIFIAGSPSPSLPSPCSPMLNFPSCFSTTSKQMSLLVTPINQQPCAPKSESW